MTGAASSPRSRRTLIALAALALLAGGGAPPVPGGPTVPSDPLFSALLVDGSTVSGVFEL